MHPADLRPPIRSLFLAAASLALLTASLVAQSNLVLDPALDVDVLDPSAAYVWDALPLADGDAIVAGRFLYVNGEPRERLVRLNADGSIDSAFGPVNIDGSVTSLAAGPGGTIYIAGAFSIVDGVARANIARVKSDGSLDATFVPAKAVEADMTRKLLPTTDGGIYLAQSIPDGTGQATLRIDRLTHAGAVASGFTAIDIPERFLRDVARGPDNSLIVISTANGTNTFEDMVRRYRTDGTVDATFHASVENSFVPQAALVLDDGSVVLGGSPGVGYGPGLVRLAVDGAQDTTFSGIAPTPFFNAQQVLPLSGGGLVVVANGLSSDPPPPLMRFSLNGDFDTTFANEGTTLPQHSSMQIRALADGGFLALGSFESIGGQPIAHLAQFNADGTLRESVHTDFVERGAVECLVPFGGGTMLAGGSFATFGEHARGNLVRLGADDSVDTMFPETDGPVMDIVITPDERAVVLGDFPAISGTTTAGIFRVNSHNVVDPSLLAGSSIDGYGFGAGAALADGSLVIAGALPYFVPSIYGILKILPDGSWDQNFGLNSADTSKGPLALVTDVAVDASNRIVFTGANYYGSMPIQGVMMPGVARTDANGQLDPTFAPTVGLWSNASDITTLPNGGFLVLGQRGDQESEGGGYPSLLRFLANGAIDGSFNLSIAGDEYPAAYAITPDNALLVSVFNLSTRTGAVRRFTMAGTLDASFSVSTSAGAVTTLAFDDLGRLWLAGSFTQINGHRRIGIARFAPPGLFVAIDGPSQVVVVAGASHTLTSTTSGGSSTATLQWKLNGAPIPGATGRSLAITAFGASRAGEYTLTLTDGGTSRTSNVVRVELPVAPMITRQPVSLNGSTGGSLGLRVEAGGLPVPTYQWFKDGIAIAGATSSELRLRDLTAADAGSYTVRVSNVGGSVLSQAAVVTVTSIGVDPSFIAPAIQTPEFAYSRTGTGRADNSFILGAYQGLAINGVPYGGNRIVRMLANGDVDPGYASNLAATRVPSWVQPDGTGYYSAEEPSPRDNYPRYYLRRVRPDGTLDPSFGPEFEYSDAGPMSLGVLPDGRIMIGGTFPTVDGVARRGLARLMADGTLDPSFNAPSVTAISGLIANPDGTTLAVVREGADRIVKRFLATGEIDGSFAPARLGGGIDTYFGYGLRRRTDGSILVAGTFTTVNGTVRRHVALLNADGTLAPAFAGLPETLESLLDVGFANDDSVRLFGHAQSYGYPYTYFRFSPAGDLVAQREVALSLTPSSTTSEIGYDFLPDGSLILLGRLQAVDGQPVRGMAKLDPEGGLEPGFRGTLGTMSLVWNADPMDNGRWLVAGTFDAIGAVPAPGLAILGPDGSVDTDFAPDLPDGTQVQRAVALAGGRILVHAYVPPFSGNNQPQAILLGPDGARDHTHDEFIGGTATLHAVARDGGMYFSEPNPVVNGIPSVTLRRRLPDFSLDSSFAPVTLSNVVGVRPLADGGAFVLCRGGEIIDAVGNTRTGLCRLTAGGLVDATFTAPTVSNNYDVLPHEAPDGKYIIAGSFARVNGVPRAAVARLNADGSLDPTFVPPSTGLHEHPEIVLYVVDDSGRVVLWGRYTARTPVNPNDYVLTRLNADGSLDTGLNYVMNTFSNSQINHLAQRENGDVVVTGRFPSLGDTLVFSIARITANRFQANAVRERVAIPEGGSGFLEIRLTGPVGQPRFAWTKDGEPLARGDRSVLPLHSFRAADAGIYRAEVISADGSVVRTEPIVVSLSSATIVAAQTPLTFSGTGGLGAIRVDAPAGTSWTTTGLPSWMRIVGAPAASGSRTVILTADPNTTGASRASTISIAGQSFAISQTTSSGRLVNISTRGRVGVGDDVLIVGVVFSGSSPIDFLARGVGPTLTKLGVPLVLPDPSIDLKSGQATIVANDNWDEDPAQRADILAESRRLGAFDLNAGGGDAAMLVRLTPGVYTALIHDRAGAQGIALAEFYDRTPSDAMDPFTRVVNISTRGRVGVGDNVLIAGFVITGNTPKRVLLRGVGPGMAQLGIVDHLQDPVIRVVRNGSTVAGNDDWALSNRADLLEAAFGFAGAFALDPASRDAALVATLDPGVYTAILYGADGGEGVAMVEVYDLD